MAERHMPIEDHAVIGDLCTAALVAVDGTIAVDLDERLAAAARTGPHKGPTD